MGRGINPNHDTNVGQKPATTDFDGQDGTNKNWSVEVKRKPGLAQIYSLCLLFKGYTVAIRAFYGDSCFSGSRRSRRFSLRIRPPLSVRSRDIVLFFSTLYPNWKQLDGQQDPWEAAGRAQLKRNGGGPGLLIGMRRRATTRGPRVVTPLEEERPTKKESAVNWTRVRSGPNGVNPGC